MTTEHLKNLLNQLHEGLLETEHLDSELKPLLQQLNQDIAEALNKDSEPDDPVFAALNDRSVELSARFAAQHPKLEPVLRELGSMLEKIGV
jgi:Domain of unknown function (DUF4404)